MPLPEPRSSESQTVFFAVVSNGSMFPQMHTKPLHRGVAQVAAEPEHRATGAVGADGQRRTTAFAETPHGSSVLVTLVTRGFFA